MRGPWDCHRSKKCPGGYSSLSEEARDAFLDKEIEKGEIAKCVRKLKYNKAGVSDGIVGKLLKYG